MITTVDEFYQIISSGDQEEWGRLRQEEAPLVVWMDFIQKYPEYKIDAMFIKSVPIEVLRVLVDDPEWRVRDGVASKRKIDYALFEKLSNDVHLYVRVGVLGNPKVPREIIERMLGDENASVREKAREVLVRRFYSP